ncbi:Acetyltransferase (GNAT) family protein [Pseudobutyrivibrio xylanivorans DSM 14809]|uniref:Acetyltransferase (GNAT) family protein n=2 Tax=Pseudobutyrivibrio xylanivorans TaxID=185007 RepID=A0A1M6GDT2_PSEXY|nr:Acetyltransferase (GNAT) family protein [Pseudobutyrivibrio xylanivorans DSM 14809]
MMNNDEIFRIAMEQSAEDMGCKAEAFLSDSNVVVSFRLGDNSKKYYKLPIGANFISYGNNTVVGVTDELSDIVNEYIEKYQFYHCFETPNMNWLNERLAVKGYKVCFMAEYYLPEVSKIPVMDCKYDLRILEQKDFQNLYLPEWSNALCKDRKELDVFGVGAYDGNKLIGLAGCSADAELMWQIGVDVLPEYRKQGVASAITSALEREIIARGKVPFYCSAWSNIRSVRNAIKSGFIPAWIEMTIKPTEIVDEMNI